jgi:hypothetical protein
MVPQRSCCAKTHTRFPTLKPIPVRVTPSLPPGRHIHGRPTPHSHHPTRPPATKRGHVQGAKLRGTRSTTRTRICSLQRRCRRHVARRQELKKRRRDTAGHAVRTVPGGRQEQGQVAAAAIAGVTTTMVAATAGAIVSPAADSAVRHRRMSTTTVGITETLPPPTTTVILTMGSSEIFSAEGLRLLNPTLRTTTGEGRRRQPSATASATRTSRHDATIETNPTRRTKSAAPKPNLPSHTLQPRRSARTATSTKGSADQSQQAKG